MRSYPPYVVEVRPINQEPDIYTICSLGLNPQITTEAAERVFLELGIIPHLDVIPSVREIDDPLCECGVAVADKWSPGAFFGLDVPRDGAVRFPKQYGGAIDAFFRFEITTPVDDREQVARKQFALWKRHVALFLLEKEQERLDAVLRQDRSE